MRSWEILPPIDSFKKSRAYFVFVVPFIDTFLALFLKNWPYSLLERYLSADLKIIQNKLIELWILELDPKC